MVLSRRDRLYIFGPVELITTFDQMVRRYTFVHNLPWQT